METEVELRAIELRRWILTGEDEAGRPAAGWVAIATDAGGPPAGEAIEYVVTWARPGEGPESEAFDSHHAARQFARSMAREIAGELRDRRTSTADEIDVAVESLDPASVLRRAAEALARLIRSGKAAEGLAALQAIPTK